MTVTGNLSNGNAAVSSILPNTTGIQIGMTVNGPNLPANTTVQVINSSNKITLSKKATASVGGATLTFSLTGTTATGSKVLTILPSTAGLSAGMVVTGQGIPRQHRNPERVDDDNHHVV